MVPSPVDMYLEPFRDGYEEFLAGPNAHPKWNAEVREGYRALRAKEWGGAVGHFESAGAKGLSDAQEPVAQTPPRPPGAAAADVPCRAGEVARAFGPFGSNSVVWAGPV
jgi:hypothetical protein